MSLPAGRNAIASQNARFPEPATFFYYELCANPIRNNVLALRWRRCAVVPEFSSENADLRPSRLRDGYLCLDLAEDVARLIDEQWTEGFYRKEIFHRRTRDLRAGVEKPGF